MLEKTAYRVVKTMPMPVENTNVEKLSARSINAS